ncbi:hypothetical protein B0G76_2460 [Paraburkholderia sp. BL23I1N1]|uniref:hypothetical protein n=1 Tax=Paraburkholderia sp. BL23I1N1 TaxID=1938802 RepID=UPI000E713846|nr:hypothetical protein [Paraburkholderia sp. BL23I1N1]RKE36295.1 hypothetical protein B0G76_2460 [Paraburkholderia sp. BL23I1N1]
MLPNHIVTSNSLNEAFQSILAANQGRNCVWAVVELSNSTSGNLGYWAAHSTQNVVQVIGQALRGRIEQATLRSSGQAISAGDRRTINEKIAAEVGVQGLKDKVGHAEERLILAWPEIMADYSQARDGEQPDTVKLYLSDSPCTVHDGNKASNNIAGKPHSCFAKLNLLISKNASITSWNIYYRKPWGILQTKKQGRMTLDQWNNVQAGQALVTSNQKYQAFSSELEAAATRAGL